MLINISWQDNLELWHNIIILQHVLLLFYFMCLCSVSIFCGSNFHLGRDAEFKTITPLHTLKLDVERIMFMPQHFPSKLKIEGILFVRNLKRVSLYFASKPHRYPPLLPLRQAFCAKFFRNGSRFLRRFGSSPSLSLKFSTKVRVGRALTRINPLMPKVQKHKFANLTLNWLFFV